MAVANNGANVLVDTAGVALSGFTNAAASNIKQQESGSISTITTGALGANANGQILLAKASGAVANLDGNHTIVCTFANVNGGASSDTPVANMALSIKGAKLVLTGTSIGSEIIAPMIGDSETQIIYRGVGATWNSVHPGVNLKRSTLIFGGSGDGHLGRHPSAIVQQTSLIWTSTVPAPFDLGGNQAWGTDNKPSAMDGFEFNSTRGNNLVAVFTWHLNAIPGQFPNNYFFVCKDWVWNVAPVGTRPTAIGRSYRRTDETALSTSFWGAVLICPTYLHIDLRTTLSATGVSNSDPTYLRTINYNLSGTLAAHKGVDLLTLRFKPLIVDQIGNKLSGASAVVFNTNANCSAANPIGDFRARLAASGITDATGQIVITEPSTKDYTSNASHRSDSFVARNRTRTQAFHKWWEQGVKLIAIADSRNGTGITAPESYASTDFFVSYRRAGSQFSAGALDMTAPQSPTVALSVDANYSATASTAGITVSQAAGVTTVALVDGGYTLDGIWKAVIDFHANPNQNEAETVLPFASWTAGEMRFGAALRITGNPAAIVSIGQLVKKMVSSVAESFNTAGNPTVTADLQDATGTRITITANEGNLSSYIILADSSGNYATPTPLGTADDLGWVSNVTSRSLTVPAGKTVYVYSLVYGYLPKVTWLESAQNAAISHIPETFVNVALDSTVRDTVASKFSSVIDSGNVVFELSESLSQHTPDIVLNSLHRFLFTSGQNFAQLSALQKNAQGMTLKGDGLRINTTSIYFRPIGSLTPAAVPNTGIVLPLQIDNLTGVAHEPLRKNANDVSLTPAFWTRTEANVGDATQALIAGKTQAAIESSTVIAKEATLTQATATVVAAVNVNAGKIDAVATNLADKASQSSVTALGTPAQASDLAALATANQAEHDATQTAIGGLPAPLNAAQTRSQVDAALTAYDAVVPADLAGLATSAQVTALGAPLQASNYVAPNNQGIADIKAKTDVLVNGPTATAIRAEMEVAGGKLDKAMKAAQSAEDQTI